MAPLILHNVPDEECYIGDDGIKRPYAMIFNQNDGPQMGSTRSRRNVAESGSFGKSTRRSRSRTGTPARGTREDPTIAAADKLFGDWVSNQQAASNQRKTQKASAAGQDDPAAATAQRVVKSNPVEMILRGYRSSLQQYAAIQHYEDLAGTILEDYHRDPPITQRRWKSELRDPGLTRRRNLTPDERAMVNRADGGEHWIKVTFESAEAAELASYSSPQRIQGHLVYAELYHGSPPAKDEACPDTSVLMDNDHERSHSMPAISTPGRSGGGLPPSLRSRLLDLSPSNSHASSQTLETGTLSTGHSSATVGADIPSLNLAASTSGAVRPSVSSGADAEPAQEADSVFCRRIPTARRVNLLPAEQALLPQQSYVQRLLNAIPLVKWFGGSMIGNEVPRTETGEFDWARASLYWKMAWWLDATFGWFGSDLCVVEKDD